MPMIKKCKPKGAFGVNFMGLHFQAAVLELSGNRVRIEARDTYPGKWKLLGSLCGPHTYQGIHYQVKAFVWWNQSPLDL